MRDVAEIGSYLKKVHRMYSQDILKILNNKGFSDLRPSFIDILIVISEKEGASLKSVGKACNLKKQTMTSHVNELSRRGYIKKVKGDKDKREQNLYFTDLGSKFRMSLMEAIKTVEMDYISKVGEIEFLKVKKTLSSFYHRLQQPSS